MATFGNQTTRDRLLELLPDFYKKESGTNLYATIDSLAYQLDKITAQYRYVYNMTGINSSYGEMLDNRWGKLLGIPRYSYENDFIYRSRMLAHVAGIVGGTAVSIRDTIGAVIGVTDPAEVATRVRVADGWVFDEFERHDTGWDPAWEDPGTFIVKVDLTGLTVGSLDREIINTMLNSTIASVKAAGTNYHLYITGVTYSTYQEIVDADETYATLSRFKYLEL